MIRRAEWFFLHPILPFDELRASKATARCLICGIPLTPLVTPDGMTCLQCRRRRRALRQRAFSRTKTEKHLAEIWDPLIGVHERDALIGREILDGWEEVDRQLSVFHKRCLFGRDAASPELRGAVDKFLKAFESTDLSAAGHELVMSTIGSLRGAGVEVVGAPASEAAARLKLLPLDEVRP